MPNCGLLSVFLSSFLSLWTYHSLNVLSIISWWKYGRDKWTLHLISMISKLNSNLSLLFWNSCMSFSLPWHRSFQGYELYKKTYGWTELGNLLTYSFLSCLIHFSTHPFFSGQVSSFLFFFPLSPLLCTTNACQLCVLPSMCLSGFSFFFFSCAKCHLQY